MKNKSMAIGNRIKVGVFLIALLAIVIIYDVSVNGISSALSDTGVRYYLKWSVSAIFVWVVIVCVSSLESDFLKRRKKSVERSKKTSHEDTDHPNGTDK
jgi:hypothetical protein